MMIPVMIFLMYNLQQWQQFYCMAFHDNSKRTLFCNGNIQSFCKKYGEYENY